MKNVVTCLSLILIVVLSAKASDKIVFVEAESFYSYGGWVLDQQFIDEMGSPYLMAHGLGKPVADAHTIVKFPEPGTYYLFVRTKNWVSRWSRETPGRFQVLVNGVAVPSIFGTSANNWDWERGGVVEVNSKQAEITLKDLTGFNGRCDALVFSKNPNFIPPNEFTELAQFRRECLGIGDKPKNAGKFDFVVVGGGMGGVCAAISAARLGVKVALIQNRPVLGGNNSSEVRVHLGARIRQDPWPNLGNLVNEIGPVKGGNAEPAENYEDEKKLRAVLAEKNIALFLNHHANGVEIEGNKIKAVIALNMLTGEQVRFRASLFADCTGDGTIGALAGAEFMQGRESRDVFGEQTAPEKADSLTMGASVQWFARERSAVCPFPDIKWGIKMTEETAQPLLKGDWDWETGMGIDHTKDFERVRDYGLLVVFSNWSFIKNHSKHKEEFASKELQWVAYIAGKRESRRLVGDYVLTETDLRERRVYPDGTAPTTWTIDLHYPHPENAKYYPEAPFRSIAKHIPIYPYPIPFRCLYSKNIENLMMAGRNISVSHVALGTVRLMRTIGMEGEVLGMAASICKEKKTTPRGVYKYYFSELEKLMERGVGDPSLPNRQTYNMGGTLAKPKKYHKVLLQQQER